MTNSSDWKTDWATKAFAGPGNRATSWMPDATHQWTTNMDLDDPEDVAPGDAGDPDLHGREAAYWSEAGQRALSKRISEDHE